MRIFLSIVLTLCLLGGCDTDFTGHPLTSSADRFVNVTVGPEYEIYLESDGSLTEFQKGLRRKNVEAFRRAVEAAKGDR